MLPFVENCSCISGSGFDRNFLQRCTNQKYGTQQVLHIQIILLALVILLFLWCYGFFFPICYSSFIFRKQIWMNSPFKISRLVAACVLTIYFAVIYGTYVPDWQFTVLDRESIDYGKSFTVSLQFSHLILLLNDRNLLKSL